MADLRRCKYLFVFYCKIKKKCAQEFKPCVSIHHMTPVHQSLSLYHVINSDDKAGKLVKRFEFSGGSAGLLVSRH